MSNCVKRCTGSSSAFAYVHTQMYPTPTHAHTHTPIEIHVPLHVKKWEHLDVQRAMYKTMHIHALAMCRPVTGKVCAHKCWNIYKQTHIGTLHYIKLHYTTSNHMTSHTWQQHATAPKQSMASPTRVQTLIPLKSLRSTWTLVMPWVAVVICWCHGVSPDQKSAMAITVSWWLAVWLLITPASFWLWLCCSVVGLFLTVIPG